MLVVFPHIIAERLDEREEIVSVLIRPMRNVLAFDGAVNLRADSKLEI